MRGHKNFPALSAVLPIHDTSSMFCLVFFMCKYDCVVLHWSLEVRSSFMVAGYVSAGVLGLFASVYLQMAVRFVVTK
jgi:hypothetical protein